MSSHRSDHKFSLGSLRLHFKHGSHHDAQSIASSTLEDHHDSAIQSLIESADQISVHDGSFDEPVHPSQTNVLHDMEMPTPQAVAPPSEVASSFPTLVQMPIPDIAEQTPSVSHVSTVESLQEFGVASTIPPAQPIPGSSPEWTSTIDNRQRISETEHDEGLAEVVAKIDGVSSQGGRSRAVKAIKGLEDGVGTAQDKVDLASQILDPVKSALEATGIVDMVKSGLDGFMEDIPWLMKGLDEVAKLHPFIQGVVIIFKAAYTMDMVAVLVQLRDIKDRDAVGPGGMTIKARMQETAELAKQDIEKCAAQCDMYHKKSTLVKVLKGQAWQSKLEGWISTFARRKEEFQFNLAVHTGNAVDSVKNTAEAMDRKLDAMQAILLDIFYHSTPRAELDLARKIKGRGGPDAVMDNDDALRRLLQEEEKKRVRAQTEAEDGMHETDMATEYRLSYTVVDLKRELHEDWNTAVERNLEVFAGKFMIQQRQVAEELSAIIQEGTERVIDEINKGPHDLIKHEALKEVWKDMGWRRNVKARLFVMTLRDYLSEMSPKLHSAPNQQQYGEDHRKDDWAFKYINVMYLQPIMEAFDDDGTGYITIGEINKFVSMLPRSIDWSLPHWIAYWAIGWQQASAMYCNKILAIFAQMHDIRMRVLPENRFSVEYHLQKVWKVGFELCQPFVRRRYLQRLPDWLESRFRAYVVHEEERIRNNLKDIHYDIDALETVNIVAGPGRIEKYIYPLLYLLLRRDLEIFEFAKTTKTNRDELLDSANSIQRVYDVVIHRYSDLKTLFVQQKVDPAQQFKEFACGMFEYINDDTGLFRMSNLSDPSSFKRLFQPSEDAHHNIEDWDNNVQLLNYNVDTRHPYSCGLYEAGAEVPTEADLKVEDPVRSILGQWNGYVYDDRTYPFYFQMSFYVHTPAGGQDFEANGALLGTPYTIKGTCRTDAGGNVTFQFVKQHSDKYDAEYFSGHLLLPDGTLTGTQGKALEPSEHTCRFILKRTPDYILCNRPPPREFEENKTRALWKFAIQAARNQVLRERWSWKYFAERRDTRDTGYNINFSHVKIDC